MNHCDKLKANPFMCLMVGGTGSGKTYLLFQMLTTPDILDYKRLVILTTTPNQAYFQFLKHGFENSLKKPVIKKLFKLYSEGATTGSIDELCQEAAKLNGVTEYETTPVVLTKEMSDLEQVNPNQIKTMVIFDDCVTERNQSAQCDLFTKGRHMNCHSIYLTQSFYDVEKIIRKNATVFILFEQNDKSLTCILQSIKTGVSKEAFKQLSTQQWYDPEAYKYILINTRKQMDCRCYTDIFS
jgi:hypothetical protein